MKKGFKEILDLMKINSQLLCSQLVHAVRNRILRIPLILTFYACDAWF